MVSSIQLFVSTLACIIALAGCSPGPKGDIFQSLDPSGSGLDFTNTISPEDTFNILEYMYFYNGAGVSSGDINRDGLIDLFFTSNQGSCKLYLNKGALEFEDVTERAGLVTDYWATGTAMVDINNDGWLDIYVCAAGHPESTRRSNRLYINQGDMTFSEESLAYGLADTSHSTHATFLDYDRDGDLDMYLLNHMHQFSGPNDPLPKRVKGEAPNTDKLYANEWNETLGHPVFTNISSEAGITIEGFGLGVTAADVNFDQWPDLYISNDFVSNDILYINNGDGTFTNKIGEYISAQTHNGMGNDIADINNDGLPEIFVSDMFPPDNRRRKLMATNTGYDLFDIALNMGYQPQYPRNTLQLHNGIDRDGNLYPFSEIGQMAGVHATDWSWSTLFADYDNDGYKDLFITNGHLKDLTDLDFIVYRQQRTRFTSREVADSLYLALLEQMPGVAVPNTFFRNTGRLQFENVTEQWYGVEPTYSNGAVYEDLDNDGDLDIVVNCVNRKALLMENTLDKGASYSYLQIELAETGENPAARGAKLWLFTQDGIQYTEQFNERGYMSSNSGIAHFGFRPGSKPDSLVIEWPDGTLQTISEPAFNQRLQIKKTDVIKRDFTPLSHDAPRLFSRDTTFSWTYTDAVYPDHKYTALIPRSYSTPGPGAAVGDIDGDGLDDIVIGGSFGNQTTIARQQDDGSFEYEAIEATAEFDDTGLLLFDIDSDGDLDLYAASGGSDHRASFMDRLYYNDGAGSFQSEMTFDNGSSSCATASDFDNDGDLDVFVGSRVLLAKYGARPSSTFYINNGKTLNKATEEQAAEFDSLGMVTSAIWSDFDNDGDSDLIIVGEWMGINVIENHDGQLKRLDAVPGLDSMQGWWNSIAGGDFDNDGDIDYIVGNNGTNSDYWATAMNPIRLHSGYLDANRSWDILITRPMYKSDGSIEVVPVHSRNQLLDQFNTLKKEFTSYETYATANENRLFNSGLLKEDNLNECRMLESVFLENCRDQGFKVHLLPAEAQFAPVHGIEVLDINGDEYLDAVFSMNFYGNDVYRGRADASVGVCLLGGSKGEFTAILPARSGYLFDGDGRALISYDKSDGTRAILATRNNSNAIVYDMIDTKQRPRIRPEKTTLSESIKLKNGAIRKIEFYYGSGYLSQSTRTIMLPTGAEIFNDERHAN